MAFGRGERKEADMSHSGDRFLTARREKVRAEETMAEGIKALHAYALQKEIKFDSQGMAIVNVPFAEMQELKVANHFPHRPKGVNIVLYRDNPPPIQHPPVNYMIAQAMRGLNHAADLLYKIEDTKTLEGYTRINQMKIDDFFKKNKTKKDDVIAESFKKETSGWMKENINLFLNGLYLKYKAKPFAKGEKQLSFEKFSKKVMKKASNEASNRNDTLTFYNKQFSYNQAADVTSHQREIGEECPNKGIVVEGVIQEKPSLYKVTTSYFKHGSLAPDEFEVKHMMPKLWRAERGEDIDIAILMDVYHKAQAVLKSMAELRILGGAISPIVIDWNYQLLTSNFGNIDDQQLAFSYIVKALQLLNQTEMEFKGANRQDIKVQINCTVFNAGINKVGAYTSGKEGRQTSENRRAYLQIGEAIQVSSLNPNAEKFYNELKSDDPLKSLLLVLEPRENSYRSDYLDELKRLKEINDHSQALIISIKAQEAQLAHLQKEEPSQDMKPLEESISILEKELQTSVGKCKEANDRIDKITENMENLNKKIWEKNKKKIIGAIDNLKEGARTGNPILKQLHQDLKSDDKEKQQRAVDIVNSITMMTFKAYMNDLYYVAYMNDKDYCGKYREPKNAAIFHAYMEACQNLTGMMASVGCKSANDRTYVARLFIAVLEGKQAGSVEPPLNLHGNDKEYQKLIETMNLMSMKNSALFSAINDSGATPKVKIKNYRYLQGIFNIDSLNKFGKYAAHKLPKLFGILGGPFKEMKMAAKHSTGQVFGRLAETKEKSLVSGLSSAELKEKSLSLSPEDAALHRVSKEDSASPREVFGRSEVKESSASSLAGEQLPSLPEGAAPRRALKEGSTSPKSESDLPKDAAPIRRLGGPSA